MNNLVFEGGQDCWRVQPICATACYPMAKASKDTGISRDRLADAIKARELEAKKRGRSWIIDGSSLKQWVAHRQARKVVNATEAFAAAVDHGLEVDAVPELRQSLESAFQLIATLLKVSAETGGGELGENEVRR